MWTHQKAIKDIIENKDFNGHHLNPTDAEIRFLDKLLRKHQFSWETYVRTEKSSDGVTHEVIDELLWDYLACTFDLNTSQIRSLYVVLTDIEYSYT